MAPADATASDEVLRTLADLMPIRLEGSLDAGDASAPGRGWVSGLDALAWHEAAHAIVFWAFGWQVDLVTIDPRHGLGPGPGHCRVTRPADCDDPTFARVGAISAMAGPLITTAIRQGLGIPGYNEAERPSDSDHAVFAAAKAALPDANDDVEARWQQQVVAIILTQRQAYAAVVAALLTHQTLDREALATVLADHSR